MCLRQRSGSIMNSVVLSRNVAGLPPPIDAFSGNAILTLQLPAVGKDMPMVRMRFLLPPCFGVSSGVLEVVEYWIS